jgi:organic radical activating enzyme
MPTDSDHFLVNAPDWRLTLHDTANYLRAQWATRVNGAYCPSLFVHYGVNSACNLRCSYCFIHEPETFPKGFSEVGLPLEEAKRVLEHAREEAMFLRFMGGEPLIYPSLVELATFAKRRLRFRNVSIITNGLGFLRKPESWSAELLDALDIVTVSFDSTRMREYPKEMAALTAFLPTLRSWCDRHRVGLTMNYTADYPATENVAWYRKHCNPKLKVKIMADGGLLAPCENYSSTVGSLVTHRIHDLWKGPLTEFPNISCLGCGKQRFRLHAFKRVDRQVAFLMRRQFGRLRSKT